MTSLLSALLVLPWIIPNHYQPWTSFHSEALFSIIFWISLIVAAIKNIEFLRVHRFSALIGIFALIPWLQHLSGSIYFFGQAWMTSLYILGFATSFSVGYSTANSNYKPTESALLLSFIFASLISVGLQYTTWLGMHGTGITDIWSMGLVTDRPYANVGQPNLLASLLIWGGLGTFWCFCNRQIGGITTTLVLLLLLTGIELSGSRTAKLSLAIVVLLLIVWRKKWPSNAVPYVGFILLVLSFFTKDLLTAFYDFFYASDGALSDSRSALRSVPLHESRPAIWVNFLNASFLHPIFGYGWTEVTPAQVAVGSSGFSSSEIFSSSHNLLLDYVLWVGWPLGVFLAFCTIALLFLLLRCAKIAQDHVLLLLIVSILPHAMLEFPLSYSFFLFPIGFFAGTLLANSAEVPRLNVSLKFAIAWFGIGACFISLTVRDYLKVEEDFYVLRFERANFQIHRMPEPSEFQLLTHLHSWIWGQRLAVSTDVSKSEVERLDAVTRRYPTSSMIIKLATIYSLRREMRSAQYWLDRVCSFSYADCNSLMITWNANIRRYPEVGQLVWPKKN